MLSRRQRRAGGGFTALTLAGAMVLVGCTSPAPESSAALGLAGEQSDEQSEAQSEAMTVADEMVDESADDPAGVDAQPDDAGVEIADPAAEIEDVAEPDTSGPPDGPDAPDIAVVPDGPPAEVSSLLDSFFNSCRWTNRYSKYPAREYPRLLCSYPETAPGYPRLPLIRDCLIGPDQFCAGRDLTGARDISGNLVRTDYRRAIFDYAHISDSVFHLSNLANTSFRYAVISRTDFRLTDLSSADFTGAQLQDVRWPDGSTLTTRCGPGSIGRCTPDVAPTRPPPAPPITVEVVTDGASTDLNTSARFWFGRLVGDRYQPACDTRVTISPRSRDTVCAFTVPSEANATYRASTENTTVRVGTGPASVLSSGPVGGSGQDSWHADFSRSGPPGSMQQTEQRGAAVSSIWEKTGDRSYRLTLRGSTAARLGLDAYETPAFTMSVVLDTASLPAEPYYATFRLVTGEAVRSSDTCEDWFMNSRLDPQEAVLCDLVLEPGKFNPPKDGRRFAVSVTTWDPDSSRRKTFGVDLTVHYQAEMGATHAERVFVTVDGIPTGSQPLAVDRRVQWTGPTTFDVVLRAGR